MDIQSARAIQHTELSNIHTLELWVEHTPADDYRRSLEQLSSAILPFNQTAIEDNRRITLLDLYTDLLNEFTQQNSEKKLQKIGFDPNEIKDAQAKITQLYTSLAKGYQIIIKNRLSDQTTNLKTDIFKLALYRAMAVYHALIIHTRSTQQPRPRLTYLNIHQLYRLAKQQKIDTTHIQQIKRETNHPYISALYKQILLFTLATSNNTELEHQNVSHYFNTLEAFANHCTIIPGAVCFAPTGHAVIDLSADKTPLACSHCGLATQPSQDPVTLNILLAVKAMKKRINKLKIKNTTTGDNEESATLQQLTTEITHLWMNKKAT